MKLSEIKGEDAIVALAELIDPATEITSDEEIKSVYKQDGKKLTDVVKLLLKKHPKAVIQIIAILNKEDPETFEPSILELPKMVLDIMQDEALMSVFHLQGLKLEGELFGSVTENTEIGKAE